MEWWYVWSPVLSISIFQTPYIQTYRKTLLAFTALFHPSWSTKFLWYKAHISYIGFSAIISDFCCFPFAAFSDFCPDVAEFLKKNYVQDNRSYTISVSAGPTSFLPDLNTFNRNFWKHVIFIPYQSTCIGHIYTSVIKM